LRRGGVTVRLRKNAVLGSGPTGADVRLRFSVTVPEKRVGISVGASDDTGRAQPFAEAGVLRRR
jgi:hypothetical protein